MNPPSGVPAKALAIAVGLAIALVPASSGMAASKKPAKPGTVKGCSLKKKAKCKKARITKAKVGKVNLAGTNLAGATITGATFSGTNLAGVNLTGARITNSTFTNVNVSRLNLTGATLSKVTFIGAHGSAAQSQAREAACGVVQTTAEWSVYECTPGGVNLRGAVINTDRGDWGVMFRKSSIPRSDFRGMTRGGKTGAAIVAFSERTDVSQSWFGPARTLDDAVFAFGSAVARESVMDGVWFVSVFASDLTNSTLLGTQVIGGGAGLHDNNNTLTGVRGLAGAATVSIVGPDGVAPAGLRTVQVRETGYFRPGILCEALPCAQSGVAVGAPVVATAAGTEPLVMGLPGWACNAPDPSVIDGTTIYRTTCSIDSFPAGNTSAVVSREPVPLVPVTVTADTGLPATATAVSRVTFLVTPPGASAVETTTCADAVTCTRNVIPGSAVRVSVRDATRVLLARCGTDTTALMASPGADVSCPSTVVHAALDTRVVARPAVRMDTAVVDVNNWSVATPIATLRWRARAPGLDMDAFVNCDGRAPCNTFLPAGATVQLSIGDPVRDTSGWCPGPPIEFYGRLPGAVWTCPEFTMTSAEDYRIETEIPVVP